MNKQKFSLPDHFGLRLTLAVLGNLMMGLSLSVLMKLNLGTDPYSSFVSGMARQLHLSYGNMQVLVQAVMIVAMLLYGRRYIGIGTIINMVFLGYITDFGTFVLDSFLDPGIWMTPLVRFGSLVPAVPIFLLGAAVYIAGDLGMSPFDAIPFLIAGRLQKVSFRTVRMAWDFAAMFFGFLLGGTAGLFTLLGVLFLGPVIAWLRGKVEKVLGN